MELKTVQMVQMKPIVVINMLDKFSERVVIFNCSLGKLSQSLAALRDQRNLQLYHTGYLFAKLSGEWYPVCSEVSLTNQTIKSVCQELGYE